MILKRIPLGKAHLARSIYFPSLAMVNQKSKPSWQKKPALTHFLCLPLVNEASRSQLDRSLKQFRDEISSNAPENRKASCEDESNAAMQSPEYISPMAIRPLGTLHLTLGVMTLNQVQLAKATDSLNSLDVAALLQSRSGSSSDPNTIFTQETAVPTLQVDLQGLEPMHDPESTSILYVAPSDPTERLYEFCLSLQKHFEEFLVPDDRPLMLHATIVNTIYAKSKNPAIRSQGHGPKAKGSPKVDARSLLQKYQDYVWAENLTLDRIAICEMGAKKVMDANKVRVLEECYTEVACVVLSS